MVQSKILKRFDIINHSFYNSEESRSYPVKEIINESVECEQIHSNKIEFVKEKKFYKSADGLIANKKSSLVIRTADCMPILFFARDKNVIGALHAGRKGLAAGITLDLIRILKLLKINSKQVFVAIGPHICKSCYEVDLSKVAINQLMTFGIPKDNIDNLQICTYSNPDFNSFRRDKTAKRNYSTIKLID